MKKFLVILILLTLLSTVFYFILASHNNFAKVDDTAPTAVNFSGRVSSISTSTAEVLMTVKTQPDNYTKYIFVALPIADNCPVLKEDLLAVTENSYVTVAGTEYNNGKVTLCDGGESSLVIDSLPALDISSDIDKEESVRENVIFYLSREKPEATYIAISTIKEKYWQDTCLELGKPGDTCDIKEIKGFAVNAEADGKEYILHTDEEGDIILAE